MQIEIFEADGYGLSTDTDVLLINLKKKYASDLLVKKINISDKEQVRKHKDVVKELSEKGLDILPVIKLDGKIVNEEKLEQALSRKLG